MAGMAESGCWIARGEVASWMEGVEAKVEATDSGEVALVESSAEVAEETLPRARRASSFMLLGIGGAGGKAGMPS